MFDSSKMKKRNAILIVLISLAGCGLYWGSDYLDLWHKGNNQFLLESDKDNVYKRLKFIKDHETESNFNQLVEHILYQDTIDLMLYQAIIRYVHENNKKDYLNSLICLQDRLNKISPDSVWTIKVDQINGRLNCVKNALIVYDLDKVIHTYR
jgi:hypothetical protein